MPNNNIGNVYAELSFKNMTKAGIDSFRKSLAGVKKDALEWGKSSLKWGAAAIGGGIAGGATALVAGTKGALSMLDHLDELSQATGVGVAGLMTLRRAYADNGRDADKLGTDIGKMQKAIVAAATGGKDPFHALGLSAKELLALSPEDQFTKIAGAIMKMENPAIRAAKAMEIFGKGSSGLITVFSGIGSAVGELGTMPKVAAEFSKRAGEAHDLIDRLSTKKDQFFTGFASGIIDIVLPGLRQIDAHDFTPLGKKLGEAMGTAFQGLIDGTIWQIWALKGYSAILDVGDKLTEVMIRAMDNMWQSNKTTASMAIGLNKSAAEVSRLFGNNYLAKGFELNAKEYAGAARGEKPKLLDISKHEKTGMAKEFSDAADVLWNQLGKRYEAKLQGPDAAYPVNMPQDEINKLIADSAKPGPKFNDKLDFVNDYMKRGLALGGERLLTSNEDTQAQMTRDMRDTLKQMLSVMKDNTDKRFAAVF